MEEVERFVAEIEQHVAVAVEDWSPISRRCGSTPGGGPTSMNSGAAMTAALHSAHRRP